MTFRRSFFLLSVMGILLLSVQQTTQLVIAASQSLPNRVYLVLKGTSWQKGDIVTIKDHRVSGEIVPYLTKRVRGVEGDQLRGTTTGKVFNNNLEIGTFQNHSSTGKRLHAIPSGVIPKGYVFVCGDHPQSFDSRYQEFGLVKVENIVGRSIPLW